MQLYFVCQNEHRTLMMQVRMKDCVQRWVDSLVKKVLVHNSWDVEQGIAHPKECVFTVKTKAYCSINIFRGPNSHSLMQLIVGIGVPNNFCIIYEWSFWLKIHWNIDVGQSVVTDCVSMVALLPEFFTMINMYISGDNKCRQPHRENNFRFKHAYTVECWLS